MKSFCSCFDYTENLSLYIHVPFCTSKCSYCAFYSKPCCTEQEKQNYTDRIVSQIKELNSHMDKPYHTAFIGGGNPGCLSVKQLKEIAQSVCENGRPVEFTTEMNPESLSPGHFNLFEKYFTRLSMGVQSLSQRALVFLGRNSNLEETLKGLDLSQKLRRETGCILSYDLITCLPSWHDSKEDIRRIASEYDPEHISLYALTLEENTPLFKSKPILPDPDEQEVILSELWKVLETLGYEQYEVSNFAKPGFVCRHNSVYWDYNQYAGLGPGAASTGFRDGKAFRIEASRDIGLWQYDVFPLSDYETFEEFVIMGVRHLCGLDLERMKKQFGHDLCVVPEGFSVIDGFLVPDSYGLMTADYAASVMLS